LICLKCKRCNNIWQYKGTNPYCTNCSKCKSTVFIKKSSLLPLSNNGLRDGYMKEEEKKITRNLSTASKE